jgi:hypothetical protein
MVNLETIKEKNTYTRLNFAKGIQDDYSDVVKPRSSSFNRNDNRLVREAISTRNLGKDDNLKTKSIAKPASSANRTCKKPAKDEPVTKVARPATALQKRPDSPKIGSKAKTSNTLKGLQFGTIKKSKSFYN